MFSSVTLAFPDWGEQSFPLYYMSRRNDHWKRPWLIKDAVAFLVREKALPHAFIFLAANSNPCEHAGKCVNTEGSFHCECLKGYTGPRCEMDINECHSNPCQNDATCLDKIGGFTCLCMPGEGSLWLGRGFQKSWGEKKNQEEHREDCQLCWGGTHNCSGVRLNETLGVLSVVAPARRTWHLCGEGESFRGLREKPISTSMREGSPPAWSVWMYLLLHSVKCVCRNFCFHKHRRCKL